MPQDGQIDPISKPKGHIRAIWAILIIVIIALLVGGGVWYWFYKTIVQNANNVKIETRTPSPSPSQSAKASTSPTSSCTPESLTTEEKAIIEGWQTHTNTAGKFEFKYPPAWTVSNEYVDMVIMKGDTEIDEQFDFRRAESGNIDTSGYRNTSTVPTKVFCIDATEKIYEKGSSSPYNDLAVVEFERSGDTNYLVYHFKAIGASIAGDYIDQFNALVKTFKFLP